MIPGSVAQACQQRGQRWWPERSQSKRDNSYSLPLCSQFTKLTYIAVSTDLDIGDRDAWLRGRPGKSYICTSSEDPDQSVHSCHWSKTSSSQAKTLMRRLIWAFAGRTCDLVGNVVQWRISEGVDLIKLAYLTIKLPITTILVCYVVCLCGPKSDSEQSDQGPHWLLVCKNRFEKLARIFSRRHEQMTFSDAGFLGVLRVNLSIRTDKP